MGFRPAGSLERGGDIVTMSGCEDLVGSHVDDKHQKPIEEIFDSLSVSGVKVRSPGTTHDFHGDGLVDQHVDIVTADSRLRPDYEASATKSIGEDHLLRPDEVCTCLHSDGARNGLVASGGNSSIVTKASADHNPADRVPLGDARDRLPRIPGGQNLVNGEIETGGFFESSKIHRSLAQDSKFPESALDHSVGNTQRSGNIQDFLTGNVSTVKILEIKRYPWSGHVYNLQTESGFYTVCDAGYVVENCLHSEENAVINCDVPRDTQKVVFVTHNPCPSCAKRLINLGGVTRVYYAEEYRDTTGLYWLTRIGIHAEKMTDNT
jgi:deoxycytidylate deaminase